MIYSLELKINDSTARVASCLDLYLEIDSDGPVQSQTLRQKMLFQLSYCELSIYLYHDVLDRGLLLTRMLLRQGKVIK